MALYCKLEKIFDPLQLHLSPNFSAALTLGAKKSQNSLMVQASPSDGFPISVWHRASHAAGLANLGREDELPWGALGKWMELGRRRGVISSSSAEGRNWKIQVTRALWGPKPLAPHSSACSLDLAVNK